MYAAETMGTVVRDPRPGAAEPTLPKSLHCCPFEATLTADRWSREILRAASLMREFHGGVSFEQVTGRSPDTWDVRAMDALLKAQADVLESDDAVHKQEHPPRKP